MAKYRNPNKELETLETEALEALEREYQEPAKTVEEEIWKKRAGDKDRYINQIKAETKAEIEALKHKLDQALRGQIKPPKSDEEVEAWTKEYPEFASILETIVQKRIDDATKETKKTIGELSVQQKQLEVEKAKLALKKLHPDFDKLVNDEDFHTWLGKQKQKLQDAIYRSLDVDEADFVITMYKNSKKSPKVEDNFDGRGAAEAVRTPKTIEELGDGGDYDFSESQVERESKNNRRWYEQNETKIMDAVRKGRFLYDLTGGAR